MASIGRSLVFSWDRIDPGTELLMRHFCSASGRGADFGWVVLAFWLAPSCLAPIGIGKGRADHAGIDIDRRADHGTGSGISTIHACDFIGPTCKSGDMTGRSLILW